MSAKQVWGAPGEAAYVPTCNECGEYLRSRPTYDGSSGWCIRAKCQKARAESLERALRRLRTGLEALFKKGEQTRGFGYAVNVVDLQELLDRTATPDQSKGER